MCLGVAVVAGGLWLLVLPRLQRARWDRRRRAAQTTGERVMVEWYETIGLLARSGIPPDPSETPMEYADRAARLGRLDPRMMARLADHATVAAYSADALPEDVVIDCAEVRRIVERTTWDRVDTRTKLRWLADPRPLMRPLPGSEDEGSNRWNVAGLSSSS